MMNEVEIKAYRMTLEHEMRSHYQARMKAMAKTRYSAMEDHSHAFDRIVAQLATIDEILQKH